MNLVEARAECERWLAYLERQKEKTIAMQKIAADRRSGKCDTAEGQRRLRALDSSVAVYDGARLADAVRLMLKATNQ